MNSVTYAFSSSEVAPPIIESTGEIPAVPVEGDLTNEEIAAQMQIEALKKDPQAVLKEELSLVNREAVRRKHAEERAALALKHSLELLGTEPSAAERTFLDLHSGALETIADRRLDWDTISTEFASKETGEEKESRILVTDTAEASLRGIHRAMEASKETGSRIANTTVRLGRAGLSRLVSLGSNPRPVMSRHLY